MQTRTILDLNNEIRCIEERIEILTSEAERTTQSYGDGGGGSSIKDNTGNFASLITDERNELKNILKRRQSEIDRMNIEIDESVDWQTRECMKLRYRHGYSFSKIASLVGMSKSGVRGKIDKYNRERDLK